MHVVPARVRSDEADESGADDAAAGRDPGRTVGDADRAREGVPGARACAVCESDVKGSPARADPRLCYVCFRRVSPFEAYSRQPKRARVDVEIRERSTVNEELIDYFTKLSEKTGNSAYGGVVLRIQNHEKSHEGKQVERGSDISAQLTNRPEFAIKVEDDINMILQRREQRRKCSKKQTANRVIDGIYDRRFPGARIPTVNETLIKYFKEREHCRQRNTSKSVNVVDSAYGDVVQCIRNYEQSHEGRQVERGSDISVQFTNRAEFASEVQEDVDMILQMIARMKTEKRKWSRKCTVDWVIDEVHLFTLHHTRIPTVNETLIKYFTRLSTSIGDSKYEDVVRCVRNYEQSREGRQVERGSDIVEQFESRTEFAAEVEEDIDMILHRLVQMSSREEICVKFIKEIYDCRSPGARIPTVNETLIDYFTELSMSIDDGMYEDVVRCVRNYEQSHEGRQVERGSDISAQLMNRADFPSEFEEDIDMILQMIARVRTEKTVNRVFAGIHARISHRRIPTVNETLIACFTKLSNNIGGEAYGNVVQCIRNYEQSREGRQVERGSDIVGRFESRAEFASEVEETIDMILQRFAQVRAKERKSTVDKVIAGIYDLRFPGARIPTVNETLIKYFTELSVNIVDSAYGDVVQCIRNYEQSHEGRQVERGSDISVQFTNRAEFASEVEKDTDVIVRTLCEIRSLLKTHNTI